ncbi:DUF1015 domain-containing protein [Candidatus Nitrospira bockiana]
MANLIPFKGVLYDPAVIKDVAKVVAPPYDVIDADYQRALHSRHPNNVIRLELGLDEPTDSPSVNRYTRAAAWLAEWLASGVLRRDAAPAVYLYMIDYEVPGAPGAHRVLKGFLSTIELEEFGSGKIFPHENTRSAAKADRLHLLEACRANFSPIFSLYSDPRGEVLGLLERAVDLSRPRVDFRDDSGFRQRLWSVTDPTVLGSAANLMRPKPLFIADGHHRYETSLRYRQRRREQLGGKAPTSVQPYDAVLMLCAALEDPGLTVLPTHRVLTNPLPDLTSVESLLHQTFAIQAIPLAGRSEPEARREFLGRLRDQGRTGTAFGLVLRDAPAYHVLDLNPEHRPGSGASERDKLDVSILQQQVVAKLCPTQAEQEAIVYTKDDDEAIDLVRQGKASGALLLNATKVSEVRAVAASGGRMPHKSTYFFPKPLTGLVLNVMEE